MSLLGRLEDLSLTDIIQIVFLSRRTGVLEIIDHAGRHTVLFRHGLIVNASAPDHLDLITWVEKHRGVPSHATNMIRQMEDSGIPSGSAMIEMNLLTPDDLAESIRERIVAVVMPLLHSREGEFNFILSEAMDPVDIEYDPEALFKDGGFAPQKIVGGEGEKIKPLKGLEESLKAGKALLRSSAPEVPPTPSLNVFPASNGAPASAGATTTPAEAGATTPAEAGAPLSTPAQKSTAGQFKVAGGLFEVESPEAAYRNVIVFEHDPLVRVAAKRAFAKRGVKTFQFGTLEDVRSAMTELFHSNRFFVTFLELRGDDVVRLLQQVKRRNPRLPVVIVDGVADLRRRHDLLRSGADLYLTKPSPERLQPGLAEEELSLFADELVLFAERAFTEWEKLTGGFGSDAAKKFYEIGTQEGVERSFGLLKQLITELSNPNDIGQVAATILRLSGEYIDRGALFVATGDEFVGLGGFGPDGVGARIRSLRIPRSEPSVLADVAAAGEAHRGKMRRSPANVRLIETMGDVLPTEVVVLPIMHGGQPIGILYGDNAEHRAPIDSMTGLEIFLSQAGYAFGTAVNAWQKAERDKT